MDKIVVLRLEVSSVDSGKSTDTKSLSTGTLVATAGNTGMKYGGFSFPREDEERLRTLRIENGMDIGTTRSEKALGRKAGWGYIQHALQHSRIGSTKYDRFGTLMSGMKTYGQNISIPNLEYAKMSKNAIVTGTAAYGLYSQYQSVGNTLSGASHAAQMQQRKASTATFATGISLSIATGQLWATGVLVANKAWQLAQSNRQEIYGIRSSQMTSSILRERLVKNTVERRF